MREARVRFFIDEDLRGLAKVIAPLRNDVTYAGDPGAEIHRRARPPCPVSRGAPDADWIPVVGVQGWVVISRDRAIQRSFGLLSAVKTSGLRMVCLTGQAGVNKWQQLETFMTQWRAIESVVDRPGPCVLRASRTSLSDVDLDRELERMRQGQPRTGRAGRST